MKTICLCVLFIIILTSAAFAQNQRVTVIGPFGVQGTGQMNTQTGRYSITDTYSGQMTQGQITTRPYTGVRIQEFPPTQSMVTPMIPPGNSFIQPIIPSLDSEDMD